MKINKTISNLLVGLRSFFWWLCVYNKWPMHFVREASCDLWQAVKDGAIALWHLLRIPIQPVVMLLALIFSAAVRADLKAAQARNAKRNDPVKFRGIISII